MAKKRKSMVRRAVSSFVKSKRRKSHSSSGKTKIFQPELMVYGAVRDKAAGFIPDLSMGFVPKGASDVIALAGVGYFAAKQKGMIGNIGKAMLHAENYEAGKLAGNIVFGSVPQSASNSVFYV